MEFISWHIDIVRRSRGESVVQRAAYCGRDKLYCDYTGKTYDCRQLTDLVYHEVLLPDHAPKDFQNPSVLWNSVETVEKNRNAQLARYVILALPRELELKQQIEMTRQYIQEQFVEHGMCADVSIHDKQGNPHAHILLTTRSLDQNGHWMCKQKKNKIYFVAQQQYKFFKNFKTNDWDDRSNVEKWRQAWAEICTRYCRQQGICRQFTHLSYAKQGIDREPTKHLGPKVKALEARGKFTDRWKENERIKQRNQERDIQRLRERSLERSRDYDRSR